MEMQAFFDSFRGLCDHPVAWVVVGLALARTTWSTLHYCNCPVLHGREHMAPEVARAEVERPFRLAPRFLALMTAGLVLAIGGLHALPSSFGHFGLAAMVAGMFILVVEPARLSIRDNTLRAVAARADGEGAMALAQDRLRASHLERLALEWLLALSLAAVVIIY